MSDTRSLQTVQASSPKIELRCIGGYLKGKSFSFENQLAITCGRTPESDLSLASDGKVSRNHFQITYSGGHYSIKNVSDKNFVLVNDQVVAESNLTNGDKITAGDSVFQVVLHSPLQLVPKPQPQVSSPIVPRGPMPSPRVGGPGLNSGRGPQSRPRQKKRRPARSGPKPSFVILVLIILGGGAWLFLSETNKKEEPIRLRRAEDIQFSLDGSQQRVEELQADQSFSKKQSFEFQKAQANYIRGRRDYAQGRYERAIQSFEAALAIDPSHQLARRYYDLTRRKFDEKINYLMIQGQNYLKKGQYRLCQSSFAIVITHISSRQDKRFQEAKQLHDECEFKSRGQY